MVRSEIISKLLSKESHQNLKKKDLEKVLEIFIKTVVTGIKSQKNIELRKFGTFSTKNLKEKNARNPRTGKKIVVPKKISIAFKMSKEFKQQVNDKEN